MVRLILTAVVALTCGVLLGMAIGDFANQRRVATAESRAGELGAALEQAKQALESGESPIPDAPQGKIITIGRADEEFAIDRELGNSLIAGAKSLGVPRDEIVQSIERIYATRVITADPEFFAFMLADAIGVQIIGPAQAPVVVAILIPVYSVDIGGRAAAEVGRVLFKSRVDLYATWLIRALDKIGPGFRINGEVLDFRIEVEQLKVGESDVLAIRIARL
jgi:hypothetical protein